MGMLFLILILKEIFNNHEKKFDMTFITCDADIIME